MFLFRLVKFESTKSLASTSSRSIGGALSENGERETALQNVLSFIVEQQKYVKSRNSKDSCSLTDITKEFNIESPPQHIEDLKNCECDNDLYISNRSNIELSQKINENENYVTLKQLCTEFNLNEQNNIKDTEIKKGNKEGVFQSIAYAEEVCLVTPIDVESENCSNMSELPVDICSSVSVELSSTDYQNGISTETSDQTDNNKQMNTSDISVSSDLNKSGDTISSDISSNVMSESLTSSVSTPDTIVSKIPRRKNLPSKIPISPAKSNPNSTAGNSQSSDVSKLPKSKIPHKTSKISKPKNTQKQKIVHVKNSPQHVITSERLPQPSAGVLSNIIDGPPHRAISFHERATSKDVIEELNRMIKNGDECVPNQEQNDGKLDGACRPTGWVHVEKNVDLNDPKVCFILTKSIQNIKHQKFLFKGKSKFVRCNDGFRIK